MRFERMTYGLEGSCSIQLSYECITGSGWEDFLFSSRFLLRAGRSEFGRRAEPERSEGGWSEAQPNREGVASGSATQNFIMVYVFGDGV